MAGLEHVSAHRVRPVLGATVARSRPPVHPGGRRPSAVDPVTPMWRGAAVFRVLTFAFVVGVQVVFSADYARPALSWVLVGLVAGWTVFTVLAFSVDRFRTWPWVAADVVVVLALMASTLLVQTPEQVYDPTPTITTLWSATPVVTAAVLGGARVGALVGVLVSVTTVLVNGHVTTSIARDAVLLLLTGVVLGLVADTGRRSHAALEQALRAEAVLAERERLARAVHDSVLQVLAYVRREGTVLGGPAADLARLAGDQEVALRALVSAAPAGDLTTGEVDVRVLLQAQATPVVSVSVPATPVLLDAGCAGELAAVARTALSNTAVHAGPHARAWVLLEDLGDEVVLSVRDDGPGIPAGRLDAAEAEGRLGVSRSLRGRVADLGGTVVLVTGPGEGTEWEVRVPRAPGPTSRGDAVADEHVGEQEGPVRVMVVDDHPMWRDGVARDLAAHGFDVVATADGVDSAERIARTVTPDVVLMDMRLGSGSGVDATARVLAVSPRTRVLVLSASGEQSDVLDAVKAGASGYLVKSASVTELVDAVRATAAGQAVFTPGLAGLVLGEYRRMSAQPAVASGEQLPQLTERETEVLRLVAKGLSARQVAARLVISHRTVENHVQSTLRKLQLANRVELARYAIEHGLG